MSDDRWLRVEEIFHRAVELSPEMRTAFLDEVCGGEETLRSELESLLAHDSKDGSTFASPLQDVTPEAIGHFRICAKLGQGGMGAVYKALDTKLDREVAIKVLPFLFAEDDDRIARFSREAKALASLNHPNIACIYGLEGDALVMELVVGRELRGPFPVKEVISIARQLADGIGAAHEQGIVHRDLKPSNILLTSQGRIKILDFGLAEIRPEKTRTAHDKETPTPETGNGEVTGTVGYMSPEQVSGLPVDLRTDLFSFGIVLYEIVTGGLPFPGSSAVAFCNAVLHAQPRDFGDSPVPRGLEAIIRKLLQKDLANRYQSASEVQRDLEALEASLSSTKPVRMTKIAWLVIGTILVMIGVVGSWFWRQRWAIQTAEPAIAELMEAGEFTKAAELARKAKSVLPGDRTLNRLWLRTTGEVSIDSVPSGAEISFRTYQGHPNGWQSLGKTPVKQTRVPLQTYVWRIVKPGFAPAIVIGTPPGLQPPGYTASPFSLALKLRPERSVPTGMVVVSGASGIGLSYPLTQAPIARIEDFLIDRHEVTNEEYKKFVLAGGYQKPEYWKQPFTKSGHTVRWEDAMAHFVDETGQPGPGTWEAGDYPMGRGSHPVAGVSWYEAAAYAEFANKSLPTAYHWTRAAQVAGFAGLIASGGNFRQEGTQPVGGETALSGFGTTDMAGNVKEWCWNEASDGKRLILGGGFGEPAYMFEHTDAQSPWSAKAEESEMLDGWTRTKVTFDAAYGNERLAAHLFLPRNSSPPYQIVVYFPGAGSFNEPRLDQSMVEDSRGFLVKSGRALIFPIYKGMYERRDGLVAGGKPPAFFRDHVITWSKDLSRTVDYLETRKDIDITKIAYFGDSLGGTEGSLLPVIEKRIKVVIVSSGGFQNRRDLPEVDPFNFAPHLTVPVLMISGRYDRTFPLDSSQSPFFYFLGTSGKDKKQVIYETGHGAFPRPAAVRECLEWLDKYLGPVQKLLDSASR
jgi:serine/threonine protein kinase/dienelactone hydrolase